MNGTRFSLEVQPVIPKGLKGLTELADDLLYSWDPRVRRLFYRLDPDLWERCGHNPKIFLRRVAQAKLDEGEQDRGFLEDYNRALSAYNNYHRQALGSGIGGLFDPQQDLIAYFCAEFGFHESFPIYSGGLGILAGDHCKAASDLGLPFVAVGLLYRQGYFTQTIDGDGQQVAHYASMAFEDLPISPTRDASGEPIQVELELGERKVALKVWQAKAGHMRLLLLDTDIPANDEQDRAICYQLYGGDNTTRIRQEMVLGIGGVRALRALSLTPSVWHINEGHAAFQILERCRERVHAGLDFAAALELVAAATVFTTHTPVPAGHDIFAESLVEAYFSGYLGELQLDREAFFALGKITHDEGGFNMTALALRGSRFHNGVSRIHGRVASYMERHVWPQVPPAENPIVHITNGVHLPTFLAREWTALFDMRFSDWRDQLLNADYWRCIDDVPDHRFWSLRQELKTAMLQEVHQRACRQYRRNGLGEAHIKQLTHRIARAHEDILVLGFARRFATYKRATLLLHDPERLARLLDNPERPALLIYAGKAHPHDAPGQELIRSLHELSREPRFQGKMIVLEGYDMALARKLVTGVDVWINTPEYPLEACGTSGEKAAINGVLNLSVLDGWWGEGYSGDNGWAITPHDPQLDREYRRREEADELLNILEREVVPLYYDRNRQGHSPSWIQMAKASMKSIIPRFNAQRMVMDYLRHFYVPARDQYHALSRDEAAGARALAAWKQQVRSLWSGVSLERADEARTELIYGQRLSIRVNAELNGLEPSDVALECIVGEEAEGDLTVNERLLLAAGGRGDDGRYVFELDFEPRASGLLAYQLRMYPHHAHLSHPLEMGLMCWI